MTNISRSTSSLQLNPRVIGLVLAALRLRLHVEGPPPQLPFAKAKQIMPELIPESGTCGKVEETERCGFARSATPLSSPAIEVAKMPELTIIPPFDSPEPEDSSSLCSDYPPLRYPTDKTRCTVCPRRATPEPSK